MSALVASGVRLTRIVDRTGELLADPEFRKRVRTVEFALYSRPVMSGREIALLLETPSPKTYSGGGTGSDSRS